MHQTTTKTRMITKQPTSDGQNLQKNACLPSALCEICLECCAQFLLSCFCHLNTRHMSYCFDKYILAHATTRLFLFCLAASMGHARLLLFSPQLDCGVASPQLHYPSLHLSCSHRCMCASHRRLRRPTHPWSPATQYMGCTCPHHNIG